MFSRLARKISARIRPGKRNKTDNLEISGHIDGLKHDELYGWAFDPARPGAVLVGLFTSRGLVATTPAHRERADVRAAGHGDGRAGFAFALDNDMLKTILLSGLAVECRVLGPEEHVLGHFTLPEDCPAQRGLVPKSGPPFAPLADPVLEKCRFHLHGDLEFLRRTLAEPLDEAQAASGDHPLHARLFAPLLAGEPADAAQPLPAYLDHTRHRLNWDLQFNPDKTAFDRDRFLKWYITDYASVRQGLRVPLARQTLAYLNAPTGPGGQHGHLTRAMRWALEGDAERLRGIDPDDETGMQEIGYWWAARYAPGFGLEDCLVPESIVTQLRQPEQADIGSEWPFSRFIHRFYRDTPGLHFLDCTDERDRKLVIMSLIVMGLRHPYILRYMPRHVLNLAFEPGANAAPSPIGAFLRDMMPDAGDIRFSADRFAALLRPKGYDFFSQRFLSIDKHGHRYHATAVAPLPENDPIEVQLIGPVEKASGLGQAARLSAKALAETDLSLNKVDFAIDHPTPEGFSTTIEHGRYKRAKINLLHLNSESVPTAFAYAPDVFNGSYNIGYFFWELDTPAICHDLSFGLLDEIWVSSKFGVDVYQPHVDIPVTKVGMCFEDVAVPSDAEAREFLRQRCGIGDDRFVFLVTFDSFSFVQRKNPEGALRAFQSAFPDGRNVHLVIKTQNRQRVTSPQQQQIWNRIKAIVDKDARMTLMDETLTYDDLIKLKKGSDCYISLHRSEGWGFGMIEAMNLKVPVVCTGYSGNMEFCSPDTAWLVSYALTELKQGEYIFVKDGQKWAEPDLEDAARQLRAVLENRDERMRKVDAAFRNVQRNFSMKVISGRYERRLREILVSLEEKDGA